MKKTFLFLTGVALLFSCKSTEETEVLVEQSEAPVEQVAKVEPTGFLTSYVNIKKNKKDQLSRRYVSKSAQTQKFKQIEFNPKFTSYDSLVKGDREQLNLRYVSKNVQWHKYKHLNSSSKCNTY
ncbi:hypothetical protein PQO03_10965 [Lentisphaera profundi]|uniref:Lipoprotein n=1 Tax=Lentisphaera profundi TaxID=1658616 RepID=A0ABY7VPY3_9BACT|nr:hypothetical protein [Lentisphaera profundi]WDE96228.1 hypothetical protein PQO03_10965 [Lentisphaera profundi]